MSFDFDRLRIDEIPVLTRLTRWANAGIQPTMMAVLFSTTLDSVETVSYGHRLLETLAISHQYNYLHPYASDRFLPSKVCGGKKSQAINSAQYTCCYTTAHEQ